MNTARYELTHKQPAAPIVPLNLTDRIGQVRDWWGDVSDRMGFNAQLSIQDMLRTLPQCFLVALLVSMTVCFTGCSSGQTNHQQNVQKAEQRWKDARGGLLLQAAQRQFDAGDLIQASKTLDDAINYDPTNANLHLLAARISLEKGLLERSFRQLELAGELDGKLSQIAYYQGVVQQRWRKYEAARDYYLKASELEADNVAYLLAAAEMDLAMQQSQVALDRLLGRVDYFDQNAGIRVAVGDVYRLLGQYDKASEYYSQAVLLDPESFTTLEQLGHTLVLSGRNIQAIGVFEQLLINETFASRSDLKQTLARCYMSNGQFEEARKIFDAMRLANAHDIDAWVGLGDVAMQQGDFSAAMRVASRLQSLVSDRHEGFLLAGLCYHQRNNHERAASMFNKAMSLMPQSSEPAILLGLSLQQSGKLEAAAQAYAEAIRRQPEDLRARQLLERLASVTQ
ncbi:MAG TPA: hypothetical protein DCM28_06165 [Phycisphaerales bacterium]|nr:hypothetical protein [Phycisphaerales bacterium]|tara:strand:- start:77 stop:1438 length:1362 start_codon:yes stop_codon:yes gene_type:complete